MDGWKDKCEHYWLSRKGGYYRRLLFGKKYEMNALYDECLLDLVSSSHRMCEYYDEDDEDYEENPVRDEFDWECYCQVLSVMLDCHERCRGSVTYAEAESYITNHYSDHHSHPHPSLTGMDIRCVKRSLILPLAGLVYLYDSGLIDRFALAAILGRKVDHYDRKFGYLGETQARLGIERGLRSFPVLSTSFITADR